MGVTINYKLAQQKKYIKKNIDELEIVANQIRKLQAEPLQVSFIVSRVNDLSLRIDIEGCETLSFDFKTMDEHLKEYKDYSWHPFDSKGCMEFEACHQGSHYETWPDQKLVWCSEFCKTQYATKLVSHKWCADLVRFIASRMSFAVVDDEGDYYHSNEIKDAADSIQSTAQIIDSLGNTFKNMGYDVKKGNELK